MFTSHSLSFYRRVISGALCMLVVACAQNGPLTAPSGGQPVAAVRPANLMVYRTSGGPASPTLLVNGKSLGRLGEAGDLSHEIPAGPVSLEVASSADARAGVVGTKQSMNLGSGQTIYWRLDMKPSVDGKSFAALLTEVPATQARLEIRNFAR